MNNIFIKRRKLSYKCIHEITPYTNTDVWTACSWYEHFDQKCHKVTDYICRLCGVGTSTYDEGIEYSTSAVGNYKQHVTTCNRCGYDLDSGHSASYTAYESNGSGNTPQQVQVWFTCHYCDYVFTDTYDLVSNFTSKAYYKGQNTPTHAILNYYEYTDSRHEVRFTVYDGSDSLDDRSTFIGSSDWNEEHYILNGKCIYCEYTDSEDSGEDSEDPGYNDCTHVWYTWTGSMRDYDEDGNLLPEPEWEYKCNSCDTIFYGPPQ